MSKKVATIAVVAVASLGIVYQVFFAASEKVELYSNGSNRY
jgi:hypothetical protein